MRTFNRRRLLATVSICVAIADIAQAQTGGAAPAADVSEVVVTGSRVVRDGFKAPTPVTTVTADALLARAPSNVADALNQLPEFRNSSSNTTSSNFAANSPSQGNYLNLRGLGTSRSLILLDGVRVPATSATGGVDTNMLPQMLIERVDVVTGGASAVYGSDAVVGVVNFILDKKFVGVKGVAQGGVSSYGDSDSYRLGLAAGKSIMDGRLHVEGSLEYYHIDGLLQDERPGWHDQYVNVGSGAASSPVTLIRDARYNNQTFGGLIVSGNIAGCTTTNRCKFLSDGSLVPANFPAASLTPNIISGGGGAHHVPTTLTSELQTEQAFLRTSYDLTSETTVHTQVAAGRSRNTYFSLSDLRPSGSPGQITIFTSDLPATPFDDRNAYLRPEVLAAAGSTSSFILARLSREFPAYRQTDLNTSINANIGIEGSIFDDWRWDANFVYGYSSIDHTGVEADNIKFWAASDAVRNPANGQIVCRVTLTNPSYLPGCIPMNLFGEGSITPGNVDWIMGESKYSVENRTKIATVNLAGDLLDLWAGPMSVAVGGELRSQSLEQTSNADPAVQPTLAELNAAGIRSAYGSGGSPPAKFRSTNVGSAAGEVNIKEGYIEANLPLLKDLPLVQSLDGSAAFRYTDYSTSGPVKTWKLGASYQPMPDIRIRATVSRDIAAPSLFNLYQGPQSNINTALDPHTNTATNRREITTGNTMLRPEVGSMKVAGIVLSPRFIPGFHMSLDAYWIRIKDAFSVRSAVQIVQDCEDSNGTAPACDLIVRPLPFSDRTPANAAQLVYLSPQNLAGLYQSGFDIDLSYQTPLSALFGEQVPGVITLRGFASVLRHNKTKQGATSPYVENAGAGSASKLRGTLGVGYQNGPFQLQITERFTGKSVSSFTQVYQNNSLPNRTYTDINMNYRFENGFNLFLNVRNAFDVKGPITPTNTNPGLAYPVNKALYDVIGRYVTVGTRFRF